MTLLALAGCSAAEATPNPQANAPAGAVAYPAGWKPLPAIAGAVAKAAAADGVAIDRVEAWGDPAVGCYSVSLALHGGTAAAPVLADQVLESFQRVSRPRGGSLDGIELPRQADGVLAFRFTAAPYRGGVRARLGNGRIAAIACFANQRAPLACEAACTGVLARLPGPAASAAAGGAP